MATTQTVDFQVRKSKSVLMNVEQRVRLNDKYGNEIFWISGCCRSTVGLDEKTVVK